MQRPLHDQNRIVDHGADQDHEAEHRQHVERLEDTERRSQPVEQPEAEQAADAANWHRGDDDGRIEPRFEERRHQEVGDHAGDHEVEPQRFPGGHELVGGAAERDSVAAVERARLFERLHDHRLDPLLGLFERHLCRRRNLDGDRPLPLAVEDLLGAAGELANLRHRFEWHELAARRDHRERAQVLRPLHEPVVSLDHEVDPVVVEEVVGGVAAVHEAVDDVAELPGVEPHVGRLLEPRHELDLGAGEIERRLGQVLAAGRGFGELPHDLHAELDELREIRAGDLDIDGAAGADAVFKQARLLGHRERTGQVGRDPADERHELRGLEWVERTQADEHALAAGHKEAVGDHRGIEGLRFGRAWIDVPVGDQPFLDAVAHSQEFIDVVARRRQQDAEHEIAVTFGEVFDLRHQQPGGHCRCGDDRRRGDRRPGRAGEQKPVDAGDHAHEGGAEPREHVAPRGRGAGRLTGPRHNRGGGAGVAALEEQGGGCGHDEPGNGDREPDGGRDRQGNVAEELAHLPLHEEHRQEHGDVGERACQDRPPHLLGALDGRVLRRLAGAPVDEDVFEHDHRVVDQHAHGEGDAREADHVERAVEGGEGEEGAHHAHRDRHRHDQRGADVSQEEEQRAEREQAAHEDVVFHESDGGVDVVGLVVDERERESLGLELLVDPARRVAEPLHHVEHVGPRLAGDADGDVAGPEPPDDAVGLLGAEAGLGHVADVDGLAVAARDDHALDLLRRAELTERADHIPPLALPEVAARGVLILVGEGEPEVFDREVAGGEQLRIDDHLELVLAAAHEVGARDAVHPLEPALDVVLGHAADRLDVDGGRGECGEFGVRGGELPDPEHRQVGRAGLEHAIEVSRESRMISLGLLDGSRFGSGLPEDEPGDGAIVGTRGPDHRAVGVDRPVANLLHPRVHLHERLRHVGADGKLQLHRAGRTCRVARELDEPLDAAELLLERLDQLPLDFLRARAPPLAVDGDRGDLDFRRELHRHRENREHAEERHQDHTHRDLHGARDARLDEVHETDRRFKAGTARGGGSLGRRREGDLHAGPQPFVAADDDERARFERAPHRDIALDRGSECYLNGPHHARGGARWIDAEHERLRASENERILGHDGDLAGGPDGQPGPRQHASLDGRHAIHDPVFQPDSYWKTSTQEIGLGYDPRDGSDPRLIGRGVELQSHVGALAKRGQRRLGHLGFDLEGVEFRDPRDQSSAGHPLSFFGKPLDHPATEGRADRVLGELVVDPLHFGLLDGSGGGCLRDLFLAWAGLDEFEGCATAAELGFDCPQFRLSIVQLIGRARAPLGEPAQPSESIFRVGKPGLEAGDGRAGLLDFFRPGAGLEFAEHLAAAVEFGGGASPFDLQQAPQKLGDRLVFGHVLAINDRKFGQATVNGTADIARSGWQHGAHERLAGGRFHRGNKGCRDGNGRWRRGLRPCETGRQEGHRGRRQCRTSPPADAYHKIGYTLASAAEIGRIARIFPGA